MSEIIVRNSCIIITDYEKGSNHDLEKNFQVWNPTYYRLEDFGMYYDKDERKLYIPRGLDIWKIKKYLRVHNTINEDYNPYKSINNLKLKIKPRDDVQVQALQFMCGIGDYEVNLRLPQLSVNLPTGKGKTYCSIATIGYFKMKSIIITASSSLLEQWRTDIKEYTSLEDNEIFLINGSNVMNMIYSNKSMKTKEAKIFLITHKTIQSYCTQYGWNRLNQIFLNLGIGIKIIDEAHQNFNNMLMLDFFTNVYKTYYVTATPQRSDWREDRIYQLSLKNVPGIDLFDIELDPHTDYLAIKYNSKPNPVQISECKNMYGLDRMKYVDYITKQPNFYKVLMIVMDIILKMKGRALIYIGTNEGILRVYKWLGENYPEFLGDIGIFTSLMDKESKAKEREKKIILSTTKSCGAGEDIKGLKVSVVLAEPFKSEVLARQTLGRTRDSETLYIELVDMGFKQIKNFYYSKLPVFNKYASSTEDVMIDQYELDKRTEKLEDKREKKKSMSPFTFHDERFFTYPVEKKVIQPFTFDPNWRKDNE